MRRIGVHRLGQRPEGDGPGPEFADDGEEMGERSAEQIQLPDHEGVTLLQVREAGLEYRPVVAGARNLADEQMELVDAGRTQRIAPHVHTPGRTPRRATRC